MNRRSIIAFVAIYALVAGVGYIASGRGADTMPPPVTADAESTPIAVQEDVAKE